MTPRTVVLPFPAGNTGTRPAQDVGPRKIVEPPTPGNYEFHSAGATPYFAYFGAAAGDPQDGFYSYELGSWHVIVLNSECADIGGCQAGSRQEKWLRSDLSAIPRPALTQRSLVDQNGAPRIVVQTVLSFE